MERGCQSAEIADCSATDDDQRIRSLQADIAEPGEQALQLRHRLHLLAAVELVSALVADAPRRRKTIDDKRRIAAQRVVEDAAIETTTGQQPSLRRSNRV